MMHSASGVPFYREVLPSQSGVLLELLSSECRITFSAGVDSCIVELGYLQIHKRLSYAEGSSALFIFCNYAVVGSVRY